MYEFVRGPLVWAAFIIFIGGVIYRIVHMMTLAREDKVIHPYISFRFGLRSILHWLTPYATVNMRMRPAFTAISFIFHVCLLITPIFALGHVMSFKESWGISWPAFPDPFTNALTIVVVLTGIVFLLRRLGDPGVRFVTNWKDFTLLAIVLMPYITGIICYYQIMEYTTAITVHIASGALWLMIIPFTRVAHMIFFPLTRIYMGSEFGFVRNSKDW